jgi:nicotinamidase-related amidase
MNKTHYPARILKEDTAAIVIDVQERLYPLIYENEKTSKNMVTLIKGLKILNIPLIVTQQYTVGLGSTIAPIKDALGDYSHIEKKAFSCCGDTAFMDALNKLNRKNVILMGIESHVCVLQTALDLLDKGFVPVLIEDCVSSRKLNDKLIAVERMRSEGTVVSTYESILFELTMVSGTEVFKGISRLVK